MKLNSYVWSFIMILVFCTASDTFAQTQIKINWNINGSCNCDVDDSTQLPIFRLQLPLNTYQNYTITLTNITESTVEQRQSYMGLQQNYEIKSVTGIEKKQSKLYIEITPLRATQSGTVYQLLTAELTLSPLPTRLGNTTNTVSSSILSNGNFFKMSVSTSGVHKIDAALAGTLGLVISSVALSDIRIYGNGGGMLPELNNQYYPDDLLENAIEVVDNNSNNAWDSDDYVLFYGVGPTAWNLDVGTKKYSPEVNLYDDYAYYFINVDQGPGLRISSIASLAAASDEITTYSERLYHEKDIFNPANSGRYFFGESFKISPTYNFTFSLPNIDLSVDEMYVNVVFGANSSKSSTNFKFNINGQLNVENVSAISSEPYSNVAKTKWIGYELPPNASLSIEANATLPTDADANAWLDRIVVNATCKLQMVNGHLNYRNINLNGDATYKITNANATTEVWKVDVLGTPKKQLGSLVGSTFQYNATHSTVTEYVVFDGTSFFTPTAHGKIKNQNIHSLEQPDFIIVSHPKYLNEANRLAEHHRQHDDLSTEVVSIFDVYNEFSGGAKDISAVRNMMRHFYNMAGSDVDLLPQYLLLLGDASFDYRDKMKNYKVDFINNDEVPTFESIETFSPTRTFCTDDYFGCLDINEGDMEQGLDLNKIDVGIGRFTCNTALEARNLVDKVIHYAASSATFGDWRNRIVYWGDDEDSNTHMYQNEALADSITKYIPLYNNIKIYMDAYPQVQLSGGARYPDVNKALMDNFYVGSLVYNYFGHGSEQRLTHEATFTKEDIASLKNINNMPLMITGTCEFSRYDDPTIRSAGEMVYLNPNGGAIAMFTTVRVVYSQNNSALVTKFFGSMFPTIGYTPKLGDIYLKSKNAINSGTENKRKFILLGDPALQLSYPKNRVITKTINGNAAFANDTIKALQKVTVTGEIQNESGVKLTTFNGFVYPTIFDKPIKRTTLNNDITAAGTYTFDVQETQLFKGKATVNNGDFQFTFIVPKDIALNIDTGKISYYATDLITDATGYNRSIKIGGSYDTLITDNKGPEIKLYMNDERFAFGGLVNETPILIAKLFDEVGINTAGGGIGHDITAIIDADTKSSISLSNFYQSQADNYQKGRIQYPLSKLSEGRHTLTLKAWDIMNNSNEGSTEFVVANSAEVALKHVLNYPNPFTTHTTFMFEHNQPNVPLLATIQILTITGKIIKTIQQNINDPATLNYSLTWDGLDQYGDLIGRGVYIYKLTLLPIGGGKAAQKIEKLVVLR